jgi:hypothetical protein
MTRALAAALALISASCAIAPPTARATSSDSAAPARERVYFPRGGCETGTIELQLYDRASASWQPHPERPRLTTDTCHELDPSSLLNELRLRCIDPAGQAQPSAWITGFEVATTTLPCPTD